MLEPDALQAAVLAALGEIQALVNQLGLAARSAPTAKLVFESDLQASLRRSLQFGRVEFVSVGTALGRQGVLAQPSDVVVAGRGRTPQLVVEAHWHPRGEDHSGFARKVVWDVAKLAVARAREAVEQAAVLVAAPPRFWRWLPGYAVDHPALGLLDPAEEAPASLRSGPEDLGFLFEEGMDQELPDRLWTGRLCTADVRSPWADAEVRLLEVKGIGGLRPAGGG